MKSRQAGAATWLIDLGNTRLKWARADRLASEGARAAAHDREIGADLVAAAFAEVRAGDRVWLASVAGAAATEALEHALRQLGARVQRAATQPALGGVRIAYAEPSRLGVDRFLAMLASRARVNCACLIASVGTALTIDLLDGDGVYRGGLIAPSPRLMREVLAQRAPHLPREGGRVVDFAADTIDALAGGAIGAARALIERSLRAARRELQARPVLLVAGGGADELLSDWRMRAQHVPDLVLEGLAAYADAMGGHR